MGSGRGKKDEQAAKATADAALSNYKENPLEAQRTQRTMKFLSEFDSGKDVKDMEALSPYYNLYNSAKNQQTNQQIGRGAVALGGASTSQLSDNDKYIQAQREQDASGMLYNAANQGYGDAVNESQFLINTEQGRSANKVGLANQMYHTQVNRPKRPALWERLLGMAVQGAGTFASMGAGGVPHGAPPT